jgi:hypothetical protein
LWRNAAAGSHVLETKQKRSLGLASAGGVLENGFEETSSLKLIGGFFMKIVFRTGSVGIVATVVLLLLLTPAVSLAHCDGIDGPVVQAGRAALESGNALPALVWVQPKDDQEIREAFARALAVRKLGAHARELADNYFFETLVRVHRAGEGAPYTGLQPAGRDLGPAIPAADKAVAQGSLEPLMTVVTAQIQSGIRQRFTELRRTRDFDPADIQAGRAYVKSYVDFVHYVERIYEASVASPVHAGERHQDEDFINPSQHKER